MKKPFLFAALCVLASNLFGQSATPADTLRKDALNVFVEATDFFRKEIPYINYVRDMRDADVYIISSTQRTGSGGKEYSYFLLGQKKFAGMKDTVSFASSPDDTKEEIREGQVRILKQGLMRYVIQTPLSKHIEINFNEPLAEAVSTDKWNSWVFKSSLSGMLNGQKSYNNNRIVGRLSAQRITPDWKIELDGSYDLNLDKYVIEDETVTSTNNSRSVKALVVKSLGEHWSYGGDIEFESSTFHNYKLKTTLMPGIEYDLFPYSESTRRQLRLLYKAGYQYQSYMDSTIYDKLVEHLWAHQFSAAYEVVQKWGSIDVSLTWFNYLHDFTKNNLSLDGSFNVRIARGLSLRMGGGASIIHDQLSLVKSGASPEEILLKRKELATQFQYFTYFGLSYTFGSIYNNVVNPRFGGRSGEGMFMMN